MNILVTGGSGFIGSHVVDALLVKGHSVIDLDIKAPVQKNIEYVNGSILDRQLIDSIIERVDCIFHIGGFSNINFVKENPVETIELNVLSTAYLLDSCRKHSKSRDIHFIYASSVYVCDRKGHLYTTSKACSERIIEDFHNLYKTPYTILRYGTVYGPRSRKADVLYLFVKKALHGEDIQIHGGGQQKRNFIDVRDLANGSIKVIGNKNAINRTLVIAHSESLSIVDLANKVKKIVKPDIKIDFVGQARVDDYGGEIDGIKESQSILSWKPYLNIEDGIRDIMNEIRKDVS